MHLGLVVLGVAVASASADGVSIGNSIESENGNVMSRSVIESGIGGGSGSGSGSGSRRNDAMGVTRVALSLVKQLASQDMVSRKEPISILFFPTCLGSKVALQVLAEMYANVEAKAEAKAEAKVEAKASSKASVNASNKIEASQIPIPYMDVGSPQGLAVGNIVAWRLSLGETRREPQNLKRVWNVSLSTHTHTPTVEGSGRTVMQELIFPIVIFRTECVRDEWTGIDGKSSWAAWREQCCRQCPRLAGASPLVAPAD
eukprot:1365167-Amorphochlora_amoeboformis.AAC.1